MSLGDLLDRAWGWLGAPFESPTRFLEAITGVWHAVADLGSKTSWLSLVCSAAIAVALYCQARRTTNRVPSTGHRTTLREFLLPRSVWLHPSALVDYRFALVDLTIKSVLYVPLVSACGYVSYKVALAVMQPARQLWPGLDGLALDPLGLAIALFLLGDFCFFFSHYLMHKVPVLWRFHEVHHSAEVLTPVTVYRTHPVEDLVNAVVAGSFFGLAAGIHQVGAGREPALPTLLGVNVVMLVFFLCAFQLRHSHLWLSYGPVLSRVFISPAQHQLHHSAEVRHWDKNFGFVLAVWDVLFRTLYVPQHREAFRLGVPGANCADFATVGRLYLLPFRRAWQTLQADRRRFAGYVRGAGDLSR